MHPFRSGAKGSSNRSYAIRNAISNNRQFVSVFCDIESLVRKYDQLTPSSKVKVNIYYLAILHTINPRAYHEMSGFVSTTENRNIATHFSDDFMIVGWIPQRTKLMSVASHRPDEYQDICKHSGLPFLNTPIYPEQEEISILCGILPHFMVGICVNKNFYINPALFETLEISDDCRSVHQKKTFWSDVTNNGLLVDQQKFFEYCKLTNYKKYFTFDGDQYKAYKLI